MAAQRDRARAASKFGTGGEAGIKTKLETGFSGYEAVAGESEVVALYKNGNESNILETGDDGIIILSSTPFYAESGGIQGGWRDAEVEGWVHKGLLAVVLIAVSL